MPLPNLSTISGGSVQDIVDAMERQRKELEFVLSSLDATNVKELTMKKGNAYLHLDNNGLIVNNGVEDTLLIDLTTGDAIFKGKIIGGSIESTTTITVTTDLYVGNNIYVGDITDASQKSLIFHEGDTNIDSKIYSTVTGGISDMYLASASITLSAWDSITLNGPVHFNTAVYGLKTDSVGNHNHGIPDGTVLATASGGSVTFVASGGHSHNVTT